MNKTLHRSPSPQHCLIEQSLYARRVSVQLFGMRGKENSQGRPRALSTVGCIIKNRLKDSNASCNESTAIKDPQASLLNQINVVKSNNPIISNECLKETLEPNKRMTYSSTKINKQLFQETMPMVMGLRSAVIAAQRQTKYNLLMTEYENKKEQLGRELKMIKEGFKPIKIPYKSNLSQDPLVKFEKYITKESNIKQNNTRPLHNLLEIAPVKKQRLFAAENSQKQYKQFINKINRQIELDEKLRLLKHNIIPDAKSQIIAILKKQYRLQGEQILSILPEQFDPYIKPESTQSQVKIAQKINKLYKQATEYWDNNVRNSFTSIEIKDLFACFQGQRASGFITLQGFVRQMGVLTSNNKFLRNRDLLRIYKRLQPFTKANFEKVLMKVNDH